MSADPEGNNIPLRQQPQREPKDEEPREQDLGKMHSGNPTTPEQPVWLQGVGETDLYGILEAPREDRIRLLAASRSKSVDEMMQTIAIIDMLV